MLKLKAGENGVELSKPATIEESSKGPNDEEIPPNKMAKKVKEEFTESCNICSKTFNGKADSDGHFAGRKHMKAEEQGVKIPPNKMAKVKVKEEFTESCTICSKTFQGKADSDGHFAGRKHMLKLKAGENGVELSKRVKIEDASKGPNDEAIGIQKPSGNDRK